MEIKRDWLESLIFGTPARRFTQDSPVLPDVWIRYGEKLSRGEEPVLDLLLTPHFRSTAAELYAAVADRIEAERGAEGHLTRLRGEGGTLSALLAASRQPQAERQEEQEPDDDVPCDPEDPNLAYNQSTVAGCLHLVEVVRILIPLTNWYARHLGAGPGHPPPAGAGEGGSPPADAPLEPPVPAAVIEGWVRAMERGAVEPGTPPDFVWLVRLVGSMLEAAATPEPAERTWEARRACWKEIVKADRVLAERFRQVVLGDSAEGAAPPPGDRPLLHLVTRNRKAGLSIVYSVQAVKADAARRVFDASCANLGWAIIDSGIDATHPAFRKRTAAGRLLPSPYADERGRLGNGTRVDATFDFTRIRAFLAGNPRTALAKELKDAAKELGDAEAGLAGQAPLAPGGDPAVRERSLERLARRADALRARYERLQAFASRPRLAEAGQRFRGSLLSGRAVDWDELRPLIEIEHVDGVYRIPDHPHGTHVAGILAADWRREDGEDPAHPGVRTLETLRGLCPDIRLFDFRVFDRTGGGDEFSVMAALQFLRHLNAQRELPLIHGANMSLAIHHDVANFACGCTPVCEECGRAVSAGVVVVAAAGNYGYQRYATFTESGGASRYDGYSAISITDPGNAESVITVGSTHRMEPHTYGVSYFSSRGPTGDGRYKPDLVAPGEKITSTVPGGGSGVMDGTSMAAPHVSGAAALLLARYQELVGRPAKVKRILTSTATDLGRDRYFQGAGMVDVLRALQSV